MPETSYPDYDLLPHVFEAWLRERFDDKTITVKVSWRIVYQFTKRALAETWQCKNGRLVFNLPEGKTLSDVSSTGTEYREGYELTATQQEDDTAINNLQGKETYP